MQKKIKELSDKDKISGIFLVKDKWSQKDKNGKVFLSLNLQDNSGSINARIWQEAESLSKLFESGDFIEIKGFIQVFQSRKQLVINELKIADPEKASALGLMPKAAMSSEKMYTELCTFIDKVKLEPIKLILEKTLEDPEVKELFMKAPAAKSIHHAYRGGLLEHILSICKTMEFLSTHYKTLDYDYLIFGAIYHDIGKIWELSLESGIKYTDRGKLVGHMVLACELLDRISNDINDFPLELKDILKHIIISHHGKIEYGSVKRPKTLEAYVVAMVDDLDSKINSLEQLMQRDLQSSDKWTGYSPQYERYFYLDILRDTIKNNSGSDENL